MKALRFGILFILVAAGLTLGAAARAQTSDQQILVDKARLALESMEKDPGLEVMRKLLTRAKGVVVLPGLVKAGFIVGGAGGSGLILGHDVAKNEWTYPAFIDTGAASLGLQIGAQVSDVVLVVMTAKGLNAILANKVTLGAEAGLAIGVIGGEREAATTMSFGKDIYVFGRSKGAYGGVSLEGAVILADNRWNAAYYGAPATSREIVFHRKFSDPGAERLRAVLARLSAS